MNKKKQYRFYIQIVCLMGLLFILAMGLYQVGLNNNPVQKLEFNLNDGTVLECKTTHVQNEIECKYPQEDIKMWGPQD